jgi:magnesium chelatase family protein
VAACNRCPCARPPETCSCTVLEALRYRRRLSGPLLDRIDLVCQVDSVATLELVGDGARQVTSAEVRGQVLDAREYQRRRLDETTALCNGDMDGRLTRALVPLEPPLSDRLVAARERLNLSGRGHDRVLRVARTIADLAGREEVAAVDLDEALSYRLDGLEAVAA